MREINLNLADLEPIQGHTSKGDQPKWQKDGYWYKADHMGYESLAETVVSRLLKKSNVPNFVSYEPVKIIYGDKLLNGCESKNFRGHSDMLIPFERLHRAHFGLGLARSLTQLYEPEDKIDYTVRFIESATGLTDVGQYLTMMLQLDAFILNEDRHTNNLAVIRDEKSLAFKLCPVFDQGLSLLSDLNDYPLDADMYQLIEKVQAKPFDPSFDNQMEAAMNLYGSQLELYFTRHDIRDALNDFNGMYAPEIIDRVQRVLFEQMRKYSFLFS